MMRHLTAILLCLLPFAAQADQRSSQIVERMSACLRGWGGYSVEFVIEGVAGRYVVSEQRYYLQVQQTEVYCDGSTRREVNGADREVIVDRVDARDRSILSNPTQVLDFPDAAFTHRFGGMSGSNQVVLLTPRQEGAARQIRLEVSPQTGLPTSIEYTMEQASEPVAIAIRGIRPEASLPVFDAAKYNGYEIIDFR